MNNDSYGMSGDVCVVGFTKFHYFVYCTIFMSIVEDVLCVGRLWVVIFYVCNVLSVPLLQVPTVQFNKVTN
jgi:hypothetical protein